MVEVQGYVRSGNTVFWKTPQGKVVRVGSSKLVEAYPRIMKQFDYPKEYHIYFTRIKSKTKSKDWVKVMAGNDAEAKGLAFKYARDKGVWVTYLSTQEGNKVRKFNLKESD